MTEYYFNHIKDDEPITTKEWAVFILGGIPLLAILAAGMAIASPFILGFMIFKGLTK